MPIVVSKRQAPRVVVVERRTPTPVSVDTVREVVHDSQRQVAVGQQVGRAVAVATRGPQGPQGEPGQDAGPIIRTAVVALGGHRVVRSVGGGGVNYADNRDPAHGDDTLGTTLNAASQGADVQVRRTGLLEFNGWAFVPQDPVYLGTDGELTQIEPSADTGAAFLQVVGHAETPTSVFLNPETPIYF